ncbi:MAG: enoyl-CoA hydratase/isomerase family protein [Streptosporangiales bacterium]|nr:enoyl-CoA hydratase/isomerase family protein [Streptosporangiales bacterium]
MEFVRVEVADGVATIRLDRPKMNALNRQMQAEISTAAEECASRTDVAAVVVYGGEQVFAAGADIKEMDAMSYADMATQSGDLQACFTAVAEIPKPVVGAVTGYALGGGCELALCCDVRIAADDAKLGQPEILLGIIPGAGGTQRLSRLVGPAKAKDLILTGRQVAADEAQTIGLVDRVVPAADVYTEAQAWAARFVGGPKHALAAAKQAVDRGLEVDLATGLEIERVHFASLFATEDKKIGFEAFVAKSRPEFKGR